MLVLMKHGNHGSSHHECFRHTQCKKKKDTSNKNPNRGREGGTHEGMNVLMLHRDAINIKTKILRLHVKIPSV